MYIGICSALPEDIAENVNETINTAYLYYIFHPDLASWLKHGPFAAL